MALVKLVGTGGFLSSQGALEAYVAAASSFGAPVVAQTYNEDEL